MATDTIKVIPIGGIGEVGKNSTVIECGDDMVLVDTGVMFPDENMHGIDLVIPDFGYVLDNFNRLRGVVLTHGHDDHVGALPHFLMQVPDVVPVYGTALTLGMAANKAKEMRVLDRANMRTLRTGERVTLGAMSLELFHVTHSIPDAAGLILRTPAGVLVHTGDFKLDPTPVDNNPTDMARLRAVGNEGVLVLLSDCVRVEKPGWTPSERVVGETLDRIIANAPGRVIVTTFASNITRLAQTIRTAAEYGRKVAVAGRSMSQNLSVAQELGFVDVPSGALVELAHTKNLPPSQLVLLTTGSQGEPTSVLARIAADDHPQIHLTEEDTVVIAASPVPGNEETVARTIDNLFRRGARIIYRAVEANIHVSGHASSDELVEMLQTVRPKYAVPMHGEYRHMVLYRDLAARAGLTPDRVLLPDLGDTLEFSANYAGSNGRVDAGDVLVDGLMVGGVSKSVLRERDRLAEDGVVIASLVVDKMTGEVISGPDLIARGFADAEGDLLMEGARERILETLEGRSRGEAEYSFVVQKVHEAVGRHIYKQTRRRPMILPVVTEL